MENLKEIKKVINELGEKQGDDYKNFIIGLICFENEIEPNKQNLEVLNSIYYKYMSCDYTLLHDVFCDNEYELFSDVEKKLLGQ